MLHHNEHLALPRPAPFRLSRPHSSGWHETLSIFGRGRASHPLAGSGSPAFDEQLPVVPLVRSRCAMPLGYRTIALSAITQTRDRSRLTRSHGEINERALPNSRHDISRGERRSRSFSLCICSGSRGAITPRWVGARARYVTRPLS